jgi:hypothetical protein
MRKQLKNLIGKVVCYRGWEVSARKDGAYRCFKNVRLNEWDWDEGIYHCAMRKPGIFVEHLWMCNETYDRSDGSKFFTQLMGVARVLPYRRANGSHDLTLSVKNVDLYNIDKWIKEQNQMFLEGTPDSVWIPWYKRSLKVIRQHEQRKNVFCYCSNHRVSKIKSMMQEELAMMENAQKNTQKTLKTATMNGSCQKMKSLDINTVFKNRVKKPVGF